MIDGDDDDDDYEYHDPESAYFDKFYKGQRRRWHCSHADNYQIAASAFFEGIRYAKEQMEKSNENPKA